MPAPQGYHTEVDGMAMHGIPETSNLHVVDLSSTGDEWLDVALNVLLDGHGRGNNATWQEHEPGRTTSPLRTATGPATISGKTPERRAGT